jgi:hypothetical protein
MGYEATRMALKDLSALGRVADCMIDKPNGKGGVKSHAGFRLVGANGNGQL